MPEVDTPVADPQLDRLNTMLDKVIRIQHPGEGQRVTTPPEGISVEEVLPAGFRFEYDCCCHSHRSDPRNGRDDPVAAVG